MDPAVSGLISYLEQNRAVPIEQLKALCLQTGYTNDQFDRAYALMTQASGVKTPESTPNSSVPLAQGDTGPIPIVSVDPITDNPTPKQKGITLEGAFNLTLILILSATGLTIVTSLATVAYLASGSSK